MLGQEREGFCAAGRWVSQGEALSWPCTRLAPTSAAAFDSGYLSPIYSGAYSASLLMQLCALGSKCDSKCSLEIAYVA